VGKRKVNLAEGMWILQKERESCCFLCSLSSKGCGVNECNERMRSVFPIKLSCIFRWEMTKATLCKKTNMNHVIRKPSVFLFLYHAGRHCHVGVSNGGKRKRSVKLSFSYFVSITWSSMFGGFFERRIALGYAFALTMRGPL